MTNIEWLELAKKNIKDNPDVAIKYINEVIELLKLDKPSKVPSVEEIRLELINNIGWFMQEWEKRPKYGKGSDRSDLVRNLAQAIHNLITKE